MSSAKTVGNHSHVERKNFANELSSTADAEKLEDLPGNGNSSESNTEDLSEKCLRCQKRVRCVSSGISSSDDDLESDTFAVAKSGKKCEGMCHENREIVGDSDVHTINSSNLDGNPEDVNIHQLTRYLLIFSTKK